MGAWGEGPYDNDLAADAFGDFCAETKLSDHVNEMLDHKHYEVQRAGAFLLEQLGHVYVYDICKLEDDISYAIAKLEDILDDERWLDSWGDRTAIENQIVVQIQNLQANYPRHPAKPIEKAVAHWRK